MALLVNVVENPRKFEVRVGDHMRNMGKNRPPPLDDERVLSRAVIWEPSRLGSSFWSENQYMAADSGHVLRPQSE